MASHGILIERDDRALLAEAGIRISVDRDADGPGLHGSIALPIVTHDAPTHIVLALRWDGAGGTYRIRIESDPPAVLLRETRTMPLDADVLDRLGLLDGDPRGLARECRDVMIVLYGGAEHDEDPNGLDAPPFANFDRHLAGIHGYRIDPTVHQPTLRDCAYGTEAGPSSDPPPAVLAALDRAVAAWVTAISTAISPTGPNPLRRPSWTPEAAAHLADPEHGRFRRQAAALYPAFAPFLVGTCREAGTAALVDARRPFERSLGKAIAEWVAPVEAWDDEPPGWPVAKLRRMRAIPGTIWGSDIHLLLRIARDLPADHLPSHGAGWTDMAYWGRIVDDFALCAGLPLASLVRDALATPAVPPFLLERALIDARDMIAAVRTTFVRGCLADRHIWKQDLVHGQVAARLLFGGLPLQGILDASAAWHADGILATRPGSMEWTWPALFEDFAALNGLTVTCLTTMRDLTNEGGHGPDADGREGLGHCIPTYAGRCLDSAIHVASIRRRDPVHGWARVSTVALVAKRTALGMAVAVNQHRGLRNAEPPAEANRAVEGLLDHLAWVPMPEAIVDPDIHGRRETGNLEADLPRLVQAWNPFLPRRHRSRSLDEARRLMSDLADAVMASP